MKFYLIAGEASGDLHGSNLMKEIKKQIPDSEFRFWGGDLMMKEGGTLVKHYKTYDHMGFTDVIKNLRKILKNIKYCKQDIAEYKPDAVIFIDFPGFNLKIVESVKNLGIKSFFYISPTVWAWKANRAETVKKFVDHMYVILPFEKDFYKEKFNHDVEYVGNPLLDSIASKPNRYSTAEEFKSANQIPQKKLIAVLPGSRESEIKGNMKLMQMIADSYADFHFVVAGMSRFSPEFYQKFITKDNVSVIFDQTYELLRRSDAAIVVSGSATLETAIIGTPMILVYKTSRLTWILANLIITRINIGLPNLIMNKLILAELLQDDLTPQNLKRELDIILFDKQARDKQIADFAEMRQILGGAGASHRVASSICAEMLKK